MRCQDLDPDELVKPLRPYHNKVDQMRIVINYYGCSRLYGFNTWRAVLNYDYTRL